MKHAIQGVDARAESFGDVALDGGASQNGAVAAEKAADGAVDQHQRIGQPEQAHIHDLIHLIDEKNTKPYFFLSGSLSRYCTALPTVRPANSTTENAAYMAAVKPGNVRKKATKMGEKPLATPLVTAMYSYMLRRTALLLQILHGFPNVAAPRLERIGRALLPRRFIQTDQALRCGRGQREDALRNQNPCDAEGIQKHGGQRCHNDLQNRVEHGGHRVALFLGAPPESAPGRCW